MTKSRRNTMRSVFLTLLALLLCAGMTSVAFAAGGGGSSWVSFDPNDGSGYMNSISYSGDSWLQPESEFTNAGFSFVGWSTSPDGPVQYLPGDVAYRDDPGMPDSGTPVMYAIWGDMSAEQLAGSYTPRVREPYSYDLSTARDDETGVVYLTAELSWDKSDDINAVTIGLNLGTPDGPRVPSLATTFSKDDGSITRSYWTDEATVAIPYVPDGEEQVTANGAVNGILPGDVIYATVAGRFGEASCPGNPICFVAKTYSTGGNVEDNVGWLAENGLATVTRDGWTTRIELLDDAVLPEGGLTLDDGAYHLVTNAHTLTGTITNRWGELYVEHMTADGKVLAGYATSPQTVAFSGYGYSSGNLFGAVSVTLKNYGHFSYDSAYMNATVTNGTQIGTQDVQGWGYVNTASLDEYEKTPLTEDQLAAYTPKNVTVTPQEDGLIVECDYEPEATQININVDVILSDGNPARLISDSSSSSSKDQVMSLEGNRQPFFLGGLRRLSDEEEQEVSEDGEQKYVNGFHGGDRLSVTMSFKIGPQMQETPWSSPAVTFTYTSSVIGATFAQGGGTVARNFLPDIATMTVTSPLDITYMGQPVFLDYTLALNDGTPLVLGTDYTEEYINNYGIGEATLAVIGMGNYSGRMTQDFTISPIPLADVNVTLAFDSAVYNGRSQEPTVFVSYDGMILSKSGGFYAEYANNVNAGTATVTLTPGYNNICEGTRVVEFTILPRSMETGAVCATLSQNRFEWIGAEGTYEPTVTTVKWGETALTEDTDYTVSYENNTATGTAYAVLTGIDNYEGVYRIPFTIFETANLATAVTIDPLAPEIYTGSAVEPEVTVRDGQKILTKGWDYSVAYSNNVNAGEATVTVTGRRDYTGQAAVPFIIDPADLGLLAAEGKLTMALEDAVYTFSGGENKPQAELTLADDDEYDWNDTALIEGTSYTLSYENNIEAGTAVAIATGMGNYGGMCAAEFTINPQNLKDLNSATVSTVAYNGQARTPAISMYTTYLDESRYTQYYYLTENVDYTVDSWANNVNAGTATVTVTGMGNNFTGTRTIDFTINPLEMRQNDYDLTAIATRVGEDGAELHYLTVTWKQNGRSLVEGTDFTVEGLYSYGDEASFYIQWIGNFTTSTGSISIPLTDNIGSLPASGNSGSLNWEISANGVMTISGAGSLSKLSSWSSYAGLVKKIVVQRSASYGNNPITSITAGTFEDFINCTECTLPEGVLTVSPDAFPKNNRMVVHLPDTVTTIDFSYSSNFEFVKALVNPGSTTEATIRNSENYYAYFGYEGYPDFQLLDTHSEDRGLCLVKYSGNGGTVTIPDFVDTIEAYGFERNGIEKVIIPGSVKRVNSFLQNCYDLRELVIQPGNLLTELPSHLISGCYDITLYIPDNITTMPSPLNYYSGSNMLIVANCDSSAIAWAKSQTSWGSPVWAEETARTYGPRYRMLHRNPTVHPGQAPTCDTAGWTEYVTCTACNCSTRVDLPALGHSWDAVTYTWNNDHTQVTATRVCKHNAAHMETETVTVTSKITIPATCISTGERVYTSKVFSNPVFRLQKYAEVLPVSGHSWRAEPSRAATGSTDGIRGGAICGICGEEKSQQTVSAQKVMQIPTMTRTIEAEAFMGVVAEQITVPNGVTTIGDRAFADCDDLLLVVIPGGNTTMEGDPFAGSDVAVICPDGSAVAIWCDAHDIAHNP